jgi:hypothetical protein
VFDKLSFRMAVAKSSDIGMIRVAQRIGRDNMSRTCATLASARPPASTSPANRPGSCVRQQVERHLPGLALVRPGGRGHRPADDHGRGSVANGGYLMKPLS